MPITPDVTIIVPLHNDEEWVGSALASALGQTWANIEVICVDDASTDGTLATVERVRAADPRVRVFSHSANRTAFQARRLGVEQALGTYVLFLDGDDRLSPDAVATTLDLARTNEADLVGFGVEVTTHDGGSFPTKFAEDLQPNHVKLEGGDILEGIFPIGKVAQGHLWRYLWHVELLRAAYAALDADLELPRANDIPVCFLGVARATRYVTTSKKLYQYFWRRGVSGRSTDTDSTFDFYLSAMDSIDAVNTAIHESSAWHSDQEALDSIYDSIRLSMIHVVLRRCEETTDPGLQERCVQKLVDRVGMIDAVRAASVFFQAAWQILAKHQGSATTPRHSAPRTVMLTTGNLETGGVQGVLVAQVRILQRAGYKVVVAVQTLGDNASLIPDDVPILRWSGRNRAEKIAEYLRLCTENDVDIIFDHHVLYNDNWPFYALAARAQGIPTIGWLHNFALRSLYDSTTRGSFLAERLPILDDVVVLSKTDVVFWKLRGLERVTYIPNPPSPWLESNGVAQFPKEQTGGTLRLVWWGRLQQHTKRVFGLVDLAAELSRRDIDFHLTIIGPDSADASAAELQTLVKNRELEDHVSVSGPLHGQALAEALSDADVYVSLSGIEGYPLTLLEAQALGMPVVMYELPWLAVLEGNEGVSSVPQGDIRMLADEIDHLASSPAVYAGRSRGSLEAAKRALSHDFEELYVAFFEGRLPPEQHSPLPTEADAKLLLRLAFEFSEEGVRRAARVERRAQTRITKLNRQLAQTTSPRRILATSTVARRQLARLRRLRTWFTTRAAGAASVVSARIAGDSLVLRIRPPRGRSMQRAQLYREVDGTEIVYELELTPGADGTILAAQRLDPLMKRRWKIRSVVESGGALGFMDLPVHPNAITRGSRELNVRFQPDEKTVQVYSR